jgi:hypothetical protein
LVAIALSSIVKATIFGNSIKIKRNPAMTVKAVKND